VLGGRLRTSKWPSRSVNTLRNIPTACDFSFTATWLAGRFPFFKSTVPEIFPLGCSSVGSCACAVAIGAQTSKLMLRNKVGRNAAFRHHFLKSCNLHSISTCCALLSYFLWRLGGLGEPLRAAANSHFQQSFSGCGCGFASAALHLFPRKPSRALTNAPISAPRMPKCPPLHTLPFVPPKNARLNFVAAVLRRHLLSFQCRSLQSFPQFNRFSSYLVTSGRIALSCSCFRNCLNQRHPVLS
jgi:hypothetical protein